MDFDQDDIDALLDETNSHNADQDRHTELQPARKYPTAQDADVLGIHNEITVQRKARKQAPKFDHHRLANSLLQLDSNRLLMPFCPYAD